MYRTLSEDTDNPGNAPEYTFEGFNIDFSEKVTLTPWEHEGKEKDRKRTKDT